MTNEGYILHILRSMTTDQPPMKLADRLTCCAELWVQLTGMTFARLGRAAVNDSSFFTRLSVRQGVTTAVLEKFARFFVDVRNWPSGVIPEEVRLFVHVVGITPNEARHATGKINQLSGDGA